MQNISKGIATLFSGKPASTPTPPKDQKAAGQLGSHTATAIGQGQVPASAVAPSHQAVTGSTSALNGGSQPHSQPISQRAVEQHHGSPSSARPAPMTAEQLQATSTGISERAKRLFGYEVLLTSSTLREGQTRQFEELLATQGAAFSPEEHAARAKTLEAADKTLAKLEKTSSDSDNKATAARKGLDVDGTLTKFAKKKEESDSALKASGRERARLIAELTDTVLADGIRMATDKETLGTRLGLVARHLVGGSAGDLAAWSKSVMEKDFLQSEGFAFKAAEAMTDAVSMALWAREGGRSAQSADPTARAAAMDRVRQDAEAIVVGATPDALRAKLWG